MGRIGYQLVPIAEPADVRFKRPHSSCCDDGGLRAEAVRLCRPLAAAGVPLAAPFGASLFRAP
jgi:hypothetical protein